MLAKPFDCYNYHPPDYAVPLAEVWAGLVRIQDHSWA